MFGSKGGVGALKYWSYGILLGLLMPFQALAQLYAVAHDVVAEQTELVLIDPATGILSPIAGGLAGFELGQAAVANDPFSQQIYVLGPDPVAADGTWQLVRFDLASGVAQVIGNTGSTERIVALNFERSTQRLIAAVGQSSSAALRLVSVDTTTAIFTEIHTGMADCCVLNSGVSALTGGRLYMTGRLTTDFTSTTRLFGFSTSGDNTTTSPTTLARLGVLSQDPATGILYGLQQTVTGLPISTSLALVRVNVDGTLGFIGPPVTDCCALAVDVVAIESDQLRVVARAVADSQLSLLSFDLITGVASFSSNPLSGNRIVNGLFDQSKGLPPTITSITAITPDPVTIGNNYNVSVQVSAMAGTPVGTVTVADGLGNSCLITAPTGNCNLPAVAVGLQNVFATYVPNGAFGGSNDSAMVQVAAAPSLIVINSITPSPSLVGNNYVIDVTVSGFGAPTGMVNISDGLGANCMLTLPATNCSLGAMNAGPRIITADYVGDINNLPSNTSVAHQVLAAPSTTSIDSVLPSPSIVGQGYTVAASVTGFGIPTGVIQIDDGDGASCTINLPAASCALVSNIAGTKTISAAYAGDLNNLPSSATAAHVVDRAPSTTQVTAFVPTPVEAGQPYSVSVSVTGFGTPTGSVNVDDGVGGSCVLTLPSNSCNLVSSVAGSLTISANYGGDPNNLPSSGSAQQSVTPATTTLGLSATPNPVSRGGIVLLVANVGGGVDPVTGIVSFSADGNPIVACIVVPVATRQASCSTSFLSPGNVQVSATYSGDSNNTTADAILVLGVMAIPIPALSGLGLLTLLLLILCFGALSVRRRV